MARIRDLHKIYLNNLSWDRIVHHRKLVTWIFLFILVVIVVTHYWGKAKKEHSNSISVAVTEVKKDNFNITLFALGTISPENTVNIVSQVSGKIKKYYFKDGQDVQAGDLLAMIDSEQYLAQLKQYEGQLARDKAQLDNAKLDLSRYEELWKQNAISKQILDTQKALVEQLIGTVAFDEGLVDNAKVNIEYCNITSPVTGKIGIKLIDEGNIIPSISANPLAIVTTVKPVSAQFTVSEKYLPQLLQSIKTSESLKVEAFNHDKKELLAEGELVAIDSQIDSTTGTIKLKASFANEDLKLYPNQFVNIKLYIKTLENVLVLPTKGLQYNNKGAFVYKVNADNKISILNVVSKLNAEGISMLEEGVSEGDIIVVEGIDKLTEGALVTIPEEESKEKSMTKG